MEPTPEIVKQVKKEHSLHTFDTRAILALISIVGAFAYQGMLLLLTKDNFSPEVQIPSWMSAITMGVIGFYFGAKATNGNDN